MRGRALAAAMAVATLAISGCESVSQKADPLAKNIIDEANLNDLMLAAGSAEESISYFQGALAQEPDRADFRRGLAISYGRAKRYPEAARVYQELIALNQATPADELDYAMIAARMDKWDDVRVVAARLPSGLNSERRHLLDAMLADHNQEWAAADAAYARAETLSSNPAKVLNNWGVSMMSRASMTEAERMFERALSYDGRLFSAKNNLAIARGLQRNYQLPAVPMTETEQAIILNNLGLIALRRGDTKIAKGLFAAAVDVHPRHYEAAAAKLAALDGVVEN